MVPIVPRIVSSLALVVALLLGPLSPAPALAQAGCLAPASGLIGWWRGAGSTYDTAGRHHGIPRGGAAFVPGKVGEAVSLRTR